MVEPTEKIILGVDPGTNVTGFGVIRVRGRNQIELLTLEAAVLSGFDDHFVKLRRIFEATRGIIERYSPDEMAIEAPFYGKNIQSMLKLGRAQGIAMAAALSCDIPVCEYLPKKVKMAISGNGNASKEQVAGMLVHLLGLKEIPKYLDATDALAIAVCHHFNSGAAVSHKSYSGWSAFVKQNADKLK